MVDADVAFRAGVTGRPFPDSLVAQHAAVITSPQGANELLMEATDRLPGQTEPHAAYRVGRALRMIGNFLDHLEQPVAAAQSARARIAEGVLANALRTPPVVWDDAEVVDYFLEFLQANGFPPGDLKALRTEFLGYTRRRV